MDNETLKADVLIVGAGPAGLAMAITLLQRRSSLRVYILEKARSAGNHNISGAVMDPSAMDELLPNWRQSYPEKTEVTDDKLYYLTDKRAVSLPHLPSMDNKGCFILSLSQLVRYLAKEATALGAEILCGYTGAELIEDEDRVIGVRTGPFGLRSDGTPGDQHQPGMSIHAEHVILAEGARGYLSEKVMDRYQLRHHPQTYGLGVKEVWRVSDKVFRPGEVIHALGWPLSSDTYGGGFIYHGLDNRVMVGMIVGLNAPNPTLSPFLELQRFKQHPRWVDIFRSGKPVAYGARVINEGGYQSVPCLDFPGGMLIGCAAGFVNIARIKGIHAAIYSGIEAASSILSGVSFDESFRRHKVIKQLYRARNIRPYFNWGILPGMLLSGIDQYIFRGYTPYMLSHPLDNTCVRTLSSITPIEYLKPDNQVSFDILTLLQLSNTDHRESQPSHLVLRDESKAISFNHRVFGSPELFYCPANVYEVIDNRFQINASNCIHCKACAIRDPSLNIVWLLPEGGGGPNYSET